LPHRKHVNDRFEAMEVLDGEKLASMYSNVMCMRS